MAHRLTPMNRHINQLLPVLLCTLAMAVVSSPPADVAAQQVVAHEPTEYFFPEGTTFAANIPSPEEFLGYEIGSFHTRHDRIVSYMQELARLSDRATYQEIGMTYEHRVMPVLTVTSPDNHTNLESLRVQHLEATSSPGTGADLPAVVHLGYGVHGNETSSSEAAMLTAYWLVAGSGPEVSRYLQEGIFHIEPVLNPDGRDRHTHWANSNRAQPFVSDPVDREHNEVWPGGRTNHYWFDMNRDWLPLVHAESRARIDFHHSWRPQVVTDYHEMGTSSTYFFEPSKPVGSWNPLLPERLYTDITMRFADDWAESLDEIGSLYFTKEVYDNTYPGYGSTYPNFLGGLGLVFEQASSRGHIQESSHHGVLTFAFAIRNHVRTSIATVETAIEERAVLREYQQEFFASAITEGTDDPVIGWIFGDAMDASLNRAFIDLLLHHRIEVYESDSPMEVEDRTFALGTSWVVPASQEQYRLARSIFERTDTFADSVFYDASAWTTSLAYGMPDAEVRDGVLPMGELVDGVPSTSVQNVAASRVAYLLDWRDSGAATALRVLLENDVHVEMTMAPLTAQTAGGVVEFSRGSISVPVAVQPIDAGDLRNIVNQAGMAGEVQFYGVDTGYSVAGVDLGSRNFRPVRPPRVLLPIGDGVSGYEAGQLWHLLDQRIGLAVTKVDVSDIGRVDWADYNVLVLVSGNLSYLSGNRLDQLKAWVRGGGTVIAVRNAAAWAAQNGLTPNIGAPSFGAPASEQPTSENQTARRDFADAANAGGAQAIGGSIWAADLDLTHPLGFGYQSRSLPVWRDHAMFFAPSENAYSTVAQLTDDPHLSGYISDENEARLANSPSVMADRLGGGSVVLLIDNPNFRGYWRGTTRLFLNALFFGNHVSVP